MVEVDGLRLELRAPKWREVNEAVKPFFADGKAKEGAESLVRFYSVLVRLCLSGDQAKLTNDEIEDLIIKGGGLTGELLRSVMGLCGLKTEEGKDPFPFGQREQQAAA